MGERKIKGRWVWNRGSKRSEGREKEREKVESEWERGRKRRKAVGEQGIGRGRGGGGGGRIDCEANIEFVTTELSKKKREGRGDQLQFLYTFAYSTLLGCGQRRLQPSTEALLVYSPSMAFSFNEMISRRNF